MTTIPQLLVGHIKLSASFGKKTKSRSWCASVKGATVDGGNQTSAGGGTSLNGAGDEQTGNISQDRDLQRECNCLQKYHHVFMKRSVWLIVEESAIQVLRCVTKLNEFILRSEANSSLQILISDTANDKCYWPWSGKLLSKLELRSWWQVRLLFVMLVRCFLLSPR